MDSNKLVAIAGAVLIASGGVAGVRAWANASASATLRAPAAEVETIHTLPVVEVRPTREQLQQLHPQTQGHASGALIGGGVALDMPYYSFAVKSTRVGKG